ncbi:hypothetical protein VTJ83DRAFT_1712 [Remersonia thermophila]|uniref:Uncharacterized protein n=1 Tax=Remersonia thermophila TaxID=72144 RepID=A0ABR4DGP5_9PEZI
MATIEPWLTNLLNEPASDLPPSQPAPLSAPPPIHPTISLPPLGPDISGAYRSDRIAGNAPISTLHPFDEPRHAKQPLRPDDSFGLHTASIRPLQLLLRGPESPPQHIPLSKILDDDPGSPEDAATKKRQRTLTTKEDFVQLPKLPKKQKSAQQVVPPIIAGLHEPPPDPAVFPPITSASFDDAESRILGTWKDLGSGPEERPAALPVAAEAEPTNPPKQKRRPMKPRRKWTEEETKHLLLGVSRHGVGRWTQILEDPDFNFNGRTAGDLKDRFRTCCPEELRQDTATEEGSAVADPATAPTSEAATRPKPGFHLEDILLPSTKDKGAADTESALPAAAPDSEVGPKKRKPRAHRKKLEDLAELGIHGPFEKSHRRKRRPFTKQDDEEILDGLNQYGPSWTRIQRDPKYHLSSRQPTDLRDRVRNKYPEIYANIEKTSQFFRDPVVRTKTVTVLEPSVNLVSDTTRSAAVGVLGPIEHQLNRSGSHEEMLRRVGTMPSAYESVESLPGLADLFDMGNEPHGSGSFLGTAGSETDLHHLLLDEPSQGTDRRLGQGR